MPKFTTNKVETVVYKGIKFRRYPESSNWSDANYYRPGSSHIKRGVKALHQEIWQDAYGTIPEGCHIHHRDENTANNNLENLQFLTPLQHAHYHAENMSEERLTQARAHINSIRHLASAWHKSEEGRAWHKIIGGMAYENAEYKTYSCQHCSKEFQSNDMQSGHARFCSSNCKAYARKASGVDNEVRTCKQCGSEFTINKYVKAEFCSRECAFKWRYPEPVYETKLCTVCGTSFTARENRNRVYCSRTCASRSRLFNKQK